MRESAGGRARKKKHAFARRSVGGERKRTLRVPSDLATIENIVMNKYTKTNLHSIPIVEIYIATH